MLKNVREGYRLIRQKESEIQTLKEAIKEVQQYMVENFAPFKVGDDIEINGFSHKGKLMRVEKVRCHLSIHTEKLHFSAFGKVLKKDGTPGLQDADSTYTIDMENKNA